jgi:hypothetical protein
MKQVLLALFVCGAGSGCVLVKPYEREILARPQMALSATPDTAAEQHMLESREAAAGGFGSGGGGCGCN